MGLSLGNSLSLSYLYTANTKNERGDEFKVSEYNVHRLKSLNHKIKRVSVPIEFLHVALR